MLRAELPISSGSVSMRATFAPALKRVARPGRSHSFALVPKDDDQIDVTKRVVAYRQVRIGGTSPARTQGRHA
jgi:hypothetical protein